MVAAQIGRQPHEIMLKRQGQRPFKDHITLADYEVSNGVQLDLELDTGEWSTNWNFVVGKVLQLLLQVSE
jgi:hypothetical protein